MHNFDMGFMRRTISSLSTSTIDPYISAYLRSKEASNSSVNLKDLCPDVDLSIPLPTDHLPEN